ncbi:MAG: hypothetical protein F6K39_32675, partial [Okeania sp. SIO3B3]|nr:hypothetical protein [Okeania sp. SIO3B3]
MTSSLSKTLNYNLPPLENGDRLTRLEFEHRYQAMPELKKAELIQGVVYMASPLRFQPHAEPHGNIIGWLWTYKVATPQVQMGIEPTVRLDIDNEPQPDGVLLINPESGGQSRLSDEGYIEGARSGLNTLFDEIDQLEKAKMKAKVYADYDEQF